MKRILLLTVLYTATLFITHARAQSRTRSQSLDSLRETKDTLIKVNFGVQLGARFTQIQGNETFQSNYLPGIVGGAFIESTRKKWGIQAAVLFNTERFNLLNDSTQNNAYFSIVCVNILAMPEYEIIPHLWLQVGIEFGGFLSLSLNPAGNIDPKNYFQPRDFSGIIGLEAKLPKRFTIGARYMLGLSNIKNDYISAISPSSQSWTTRAAQVYVGFNFDNKKMEK
jgi:hypothetical protein